MRYPVIPVLVSPSRTTRGVSWAIGSCGEYSSQPYCRGEFSSSPSQFRTTGLSALDKWGILSLFISKREKIDYRGDAFSQWLINLQYVGVSSTLSTTLCIEPALLTSTVLATQCPSLPSSTSSVRVSQNISLCSSIFLSSASCSSSVRSFDS